MVLASIIVPYHVVPSSCQPFPLDLRRRTREQVSACRRVLVEQPVDGDAAFGSCSVELNVLAGPTPLEQSVILRPLGDVEAIARQPIVEAIY